MATRLLMGEVGEEESGMTLDNCFIVIITVLVVLSILFEKGKEHIDHATEDAMKPIVAHLWAELTILGFLSLLSFLVVKSGILQGPSEALFGEEEELQEAVETVHMLLFLVMMIFGAIVGGLIVVGNYFARNWRLQEAVSKEPAQVFQKLIRLREQNPESHENCCGMISDAHAEYLFPFSSLHKDSKAVSQFNYTVMRQGFVNPSHSALLHGKGVPSDFKFCQYLTIRLGEMLAEVVEIPPTVWALLEGFFVLFWAAAYLPTDFVIEAFLLLGYGLLLAAVLVSQHLDAVRHQLLLTIPPLEALKASLAKYHHDVHSKEMRKKQKEHQLKKARVKRHTMAAMGGAVPSLQAFFEEEKKSTGHDDEHDADPADHDEHADPADPADPAEEESADQKSDNSDSEDEHDHDHGDGPIFPGGLGIPPYLHTPIVHHHNQHQGLFWFGEEAEEYFLHGMRVAMMLTSIYMAMLIFYITPSVASMGVMSVTIGFLVIALLPIAGLCYYTPHILRRMTEVFSIEMMKEHEVIEDTELFMSTERSLRMIQMIQLMQQLKMIEELTGASADVDYKTLSEDEKEALAAKKKHKVSAAIAISEETKQQLKDAFALFDDDNSGDLESGEIANMLKVLGIDPAQQQTIINVLDKDGDGLVSEDEFIETMGVLVQRQSLDPDALCDEIFDIFDVDGDKCLQTSEVRDKLVKFGMKREHADDVCHEFDRDNDGEIDELEFKRLLRRHLDL